MTRKCTFESLFYLYYILKLFWRKTRFFCFKNYNILLCFLTLALVFTHWIPVKSSIKRHWMGLILKFRRIESAIVAVAMVISAPMFVYGGGIGNCAMLLGPLFCRFQSTFTHSTINTSATDALTCVTQTKHYVLVRIGHRLPMTSLQKSNNFMSI